MPSQIAGFSGANILRKRLYHVTFLGARVIHLSISVTVRSDPATMDDLQGPVAIRLVDSKELIDFVLKHSLTSALICCTSRSDFLADLQGKLQRTPTTQLPNSDGSCDYLSPTLQILTTSRKIKLAFTPTLPHLRAYLTALLPPTDHKTAWIECHRESCPMPMLVILGLVELHRASSEHSAQGISRTLAIAVEAARLAGMKLSLGEYYKEVDNDNNNGIHDGAAKIYDGGQQDPWTEQIPVLSGSVRFGHNEGCRGTTVSVRKVLGRWCRFVTLDTMLPVELEMQPP